MQRFLNSERLILKKKNKVPKCQTRQTQGPQVQKNPKINNKQNDNHRRDVCAITIIYDCGSYCCD